VPYTLHDRGPHCHAVREVVGLKRAEEVLEQCHWHGTEAGRGVWEVSLSHQVLVGAPELGPLSFEHAVELCDELVQRSAVGDPGGTRESEAGGQIHLALKCCLRRRP
jgi:hypothetical protein